MATPFGRRGVFNEPFRRSSGAQAPNNRGASAKQAAEEFRDLLRKTKMSNESITRREADDAFRDWQRQQKFRKPDPSVPSIPRAVEKQAQNRAREIASRIIRTGLRIHPFRLVFKWVLDWLIKWLIDWLLKWRPWETGSTGWRKFGTCSSPPTDAIRPVVFWGGALYPPSQTSINQSNSCLPGQGVPKGSIAVKDALADFPYPSVLNASGYLPRGQTATTWTNCTNVETWGRPGPGRTLPSIWIIPGSDRPPMNELPPPPKRIRDALIPQWKQEIEPDRPPEVNEEPPPASEEQQEPHKEIEWGRDTKTGVKVEYRYRQKPTRYSEKEQKFVGASETIKEIFRRVSRAKEHLTEADDFLDTLFDALPKEVQDSIKKRNGRMTPDLKMRAIYDHYDKIDWNDWLKNFVKNYWQDKAVGRGIELSDKFAKGRGASNTVSSRWWLHGAR